MHAWNRPTVYPTPAWQTAGAVIFCQCIAMILGITVLRIFIILNIVGGLNIGESLAQ